MKKNKFRLVVIGQATRTVSTPALARLMTLVPPLNLNETPVPQEVLVCGWISELRELTGLIAELSDLDADVSVVTDALVYPPCVKSELLQVFGRLHDGQVHLTKVGAVAARIGRRGFNRAENSAGLCLVIGKGRHKRILVIDRETEPYGLALPSGFWKIGAENKQRCACRETEEETGVVVDDEWLMTIDEYSDPDMDPRDYVAEVIFGCHVMDRFIIRRMKDQLRPKLDEVKDARFMTLEKFRQGTVAFARHLDAAEQFYSRLG